MSKSPTDTYKQLDLWAPKEPLLQGPRKSAALPPNPTFYYAVAFWTQSGFSVKQGVTVNTLTAGP